MVRSLYTAATGMQSQQMNIDNISNNLANVNNAGFKKGRILFEDLMYQELRAAGSTTATGTRHPTGIQQGLGVATVAIEKIHSQGSPRFTENPIDIMINGDGFFQVELPDGSIGYTRQGSFKIDANGDVVTPQGYRLFPNINVPENSLILNVTHDGVFTVYLPGDMEETEIGQIDIARFINPAGLKPSGKTFIWKRVLPVPYR